MTAMSSLFLPVPSQIVLPLAGFLVGQGSFSFPLVLLAATAGSSGASLVPYAVGRRLGEERLRRFVRRRFGRFVLVDESSFDKASGWFARRGGVTVLICRLVPGVGSFISVPAGIERMPVWKFLFYTALGRAVPGTRRLLPSDGCSAPNGPWYASTTRLPSSTRRWPPSRARFCGSCRAGGRKRANERPERPSQNRRENSTD